MSTKSKGKLAALAAIGALAASGGAIAATGGAARDSTKPKPIPYEIVDRRPGDVAANWADVSKAREELGWEATRDLDDMCADSWRWQQSAR